MLEKLREHLPLAATILVMGTFLSILAPYNTSQFGWPFVWIYWTGLMGFGWLCAFIIRDAMEKRLPGWPPFPFYALMSAAISVPMTGAVLAVQLLRGETFPPIAVPIVFVSVWVISAGVTFVGYLQERSEKSKNPEPVAEAGRALLDKLPPKLQRAAVLALESEDHYLRVHTDAGDALILMRLSDAMAAVEALDGAQTHRSWWVARTAVDNVSRGDGRATLALRNGVTAPVSRTYSPKLREAGWY